MAMGGEEYGHGWSVMNRPWVVMSTALGGDEYGHGGDEYGHGGDKYGLGW